MCKSCKAAVDAGRTNKAMCAACGWRQGATCGRSGHMITAETVHQGVHCPLGRHTVAERGGVVEWFGMRWHGVPAPVRVELAVRGVKLRGGQELPGCGCLVAVKAWAERHGVAQEVGQLAELAMQWLTGVRLLITSVRRAALG
jgi:hypothetical protein